MSKHFLPIFTSVFLFFVLLSVSIASSSAQNTQKDVLSPLERRLKDRVRHEFGLQNKPLPQLDSRLVLAARRRAETLLEASEKDLKRESATDLHAWIRAFGAVDYQLKSSFILAKDPETLLKKLSQWSSGIAGEKPWSHFGAGTAQWQGRHAAVVFLVWRPVQIKPFSNPLERPGSVRLEGQAPFGLKGLRLQLTDPRHRSRVIHPSLTGGRFSEMLPFDTLGNWTLEILVDTRHGPTVVALIPVQVGPKSAVLPIPHLKEPNPATEDSAARALLQWTQRLRLSLGLKTLESSPELQRVARSYAEKMVDQGFFGHLDPQGEGVTERLKKAGIQTRAFGENIASNVSLSRMAKRLYESPAHRNNLLRNDFNNIGVAVVRSTKNGNSEWVAVQLFADLPTVKPTYPVEDLGEVHPELWKQVRENRKAQGLPKIVVDPVLNRLAESLVRKSKRGNRLDAVKLEKLTVQAIENDGSHLIQTYALIRLREKSALRSVYLLNQRSFNLVGARFLKNADNTLTAFLILGHLEMKSEDSNKKRR